MGTYVRRTTGGALLLESGQVGSCSVANAQSWTATASCAVSATTNDIGWG